MKPNGRRAWRRWMRRVENNPNLRPPGKSISRLAREGKRHLVSIPPTPAKPLTARSLVGMTMGARKRAARADCYNIRTHVHDFRNQLRIGERLRPCPGCCACWGHRISSAYGEIAECCGPQTSGKRKSQIKAMRKWQETLADNCDGSGVLPARRSK